MRKIIFLAAIARTPVSFALAQTPKHASTENLKREQEIRMVLDDFAQAFAQVGTAVFAELDRCMSFREESTHVLAVNSGEGRCLQHDIK